MAMGGFGKNKKVAIRRELLFGTLVHYRDM